MSADKNWDEVSNREDAEEQHEALDLTEGDQEELTEELDVAQTEAKRNYELFLRAQADLENVKRRAKLDVENAHKFGIKRLIEELVPVLDSLEQGLQTKPDDVQSDAFDQIFKGMELTYSMLLDTLKKHGIEQLNPEGEAFNPEHHEAMSMVETDGVETNTVITVFQKGYILHGRVLRPARVIVAK